jgi:low affinity Fe/Cu permease
MFALVLTVLIILANAAASALLMVGYRRYGLHWRVVNYASLAMALVSCVVVLASDAQAPPLFTLTEANSVFLAVAIFTPATVLVVQAWQHRERQAS